MDWALASARRRVATKQTPWVTGAGQGQILCFLLQTSLRGNTKRQRRAREEGQRAVAARSECGVSAGALSSGFQLKAIVPRLIEAAAGQLSLCAHS